MENNIDILSNLVLGIFFWIYKLEEVTHMLLDVMLVLKYFGNT